MAIFGLIIINKSGGLIYQRQFQEGGLNKLSVNDYLMLAGTFHGVHAISTRLHPVPSQGAAFDVAAAGEAAPTATSAAPASAPLPNRRDYTMIHGQAVPCRAEAPSGIEVLETETFRLQCYTTVTGLKFLTFTDLHHPNVDIVNKRIHELYADYAMKNPFYQLEMPIRCELFDRKLLSYIRDMNSR